MSDIHQVSSVTPNTTVAPSAANPITAGAAASSNPNGVTTSTKLNSIEDLKKQAPELYNKMMESIGMKVCNEMKDHQERLKRLMREGRG